MRPIGTKIRCRCCELDDQPENARRLPVDAQHGHCVADPAEQVAVGIEDADAGQPGEEDPRSPGS